MKSMITVLPAAAMALAALPAAAMAQDSSGSQLISAGHTLLTLSADGKSTRTPDLAVFSAGVSSQGKTAGEAMAANAANMNRVIAALKKAGIADRDIQTSNINLNPVYAQPVVGPNGQIDNQEPRIIGYQASNTLSVRQRDLKQFGKVLDTLVAAGANQINGPSFEVDNPDSALDEARLAAMQKARARADLYARAAGLKVARIISISESGGYAPPRPMMYAMKAMADSAPTPVAAGEVELNINVTVQFELAP